MKILIADPAKNITVFVLDAVDDSAERSSLARAILEDEKLKAEQLGFVSAPSEHSNGLWRLDMSGGEFCGNAARSFGLYVAGIQGLKGKGTVFVSVSGADKPVPVHFDTERSFARAEMPKPLVVKNIDYKGRSLPLMVFEGITHVIAPDLEADRENFFSIKLIAESGLSEANIPAAFGVMFYDTVSLFLRPAVSVRSGGNLVFESSCGSGSAALGVWLSREMSDGAFSFPITQSGGVIETEVTKKAGEIISITIGGELKLGKAFEFP